MRTYDELSKADQESAHDKALSRLLTAICEGAIRFNDELNGDDLQARIDAAFEKAEAMRTPWFAHEYVMETCDEELRSMALCDAEDAVYRSADDPCVVTL